MVRLRRILLLILILVILFLGSATGFGVYMTRRMLPQVDGTLSLPGLDGEVTIYRDAAGIPQIYATTVHDLFFAQGVVQAQDRWWQMEFNRHTALGRISELTGKNDTALRSDIFIRTVGWNRAAQADIQAMPPETMNVLNAYTSGVNAYLAGKSNYDLALEYALLRANGIRIPIEPWEPVDSVAWVKVMSWSLSGNMDSELQLAALYTKFGDKKALIDQFYVPPYPFDQRQTIVMNEDLPITAPQTIQQVPAVAPGTDLSHIQTTLAGGVPANFGPLFGKQTGVGSNNWVLSGARTASGKPLLANDPHLGIQQPSIWYELGLHCVQVSAACPYDVEGFSFPGAPGIVIGHNQRIAWGVTNVGPDTQDLYIIKVNPNDDTQYEVDGKTLDMQVVNETIRFGDDTPPQDVRVRITRFGPIVTDTPSYASKSDQPLALHWTAITDTADVLGALLGVDRAADWSGFRQALTGWATPAQNFIYADVDGNIGYQTPGLIPIRANGHSGLTPVDGSTTKYDWKGYIPFENLPRAYNPPRGYIESANEAVVPPAYYTQLVAQIGDRFGRDSNYLISYTWDYGYRGARITQLIKATEKHTVDTVKAIQQDTYNGFAAEVLPYALKLDYGNEVPADVIEWMKQWDYRDQASSGQAALFETFWVQLDHTLWGNPLGFIPDGPNVWWGTNLLLDQPNNAWWDDPYTPGLTETRDTVLRNAFLAAYNRMIARLGQDYTRWTWGALHTATFVSNPLGASGIQVIENLVNTGPVPVNGGSPTVNRTGWNAADPYGTSSISSMRMIVDLSNLDNSLWIQSTGQSGHPTSPHYRDMTDRWRTGQYDPMLASQSSVQKAAVSTLTLKPQ